MGMEGIDSLESEVRTENVKAQVGAGDVSFQSVQEL